MLSEKMKEMWAGTARAVLGLLWILTVFCFSARSSCAVRRFGVGSALSGTPATNEVSHSALQLVGSNAVLRCDMSAFAMMVLFATRCQEERVLCPKINWVRPQACCTGSHCRRKRPLGEAAQPAGELRTLCVQVKTAIGSVGNDVRCWIRHGSRVAFGTLLVTV